MPKGNDWFNFVYVNVAYLALAFGITFYIGLQEIYKNWPKYRCNPVYMPLSKDMTGDFTYCVQNMQMNYMGTLLKPLWWIISSIGTMAKDVTGTLQNFRGMISKIRSRFTNIIGSVMGIFMNLIIQIQKMSISIKDTVGKLSGVLVTVLYMLDGTSKTMQSAWNGPPGQMTRALCFRPDTLVGMANGKKVQMQDISLGDVLDNGSKVTAVIELANTTNECFYKFRGDDGDIYVTGQHYVLDDTIDKFVQVKDHPDAEATSELGERFSCLLTHDHKIPVGGHTFWDWDDDIFTYGSDSVDNKV